MTRRGTITCAAILFVLSLRAQEQERKIAKKELPAPVLAMLQKGSPRAIIKGITVETADGEMRYGVAMVEGKSFRELFYRPDGTVVEVDEDLPVVKLPVVVMGSIKTRHPKPVITKAVKVTTGGVVRYSVYISTGKGKLKLDLDSSGTLLHETQT